MKKLMMEFIVLFCLIIACKAYSIEPTEASSGLENAGGVNALLYKGGKIFAGTGSGYYAYTGKSGMYVSSDEGNSWNSINTGLQSTDIQCLINDGDIIYAGTNKGVFYTTNDGQNWISANNGLTAQIKCLLKVNNVIFAGSLFEGLHKSTDNGQTWEKVTNGMDQDIVVCLAEKDGQIICGTMMGGAYFSTDMGQSWTVKNNGLLNTRVFSLLIDNNDIYAGSFDGGMYYSSDNGENWEVRNNGFLDEMIDPWSLFSYQNKIYAGVNRRGLFSTTNKGENWNLEYLNPYLSQLEIQGILSFIIVNDCIYSGHDTGKIFKLNINTSEVSYESLSSKNMCCYPNPSNDYLEISNLEPGTNHCNIYTLEGKLVKGIDIEVSSSLKVRIDLTGLNIGTYLLEIIKDNKIKSSIFSFQR